MPKKNKDTRTTESVENFLKAVYSLEQGIEGEERVSTNALSDSLSISAPSVTDMAQRLDEEGYIDYQRYKGIRLTSAGSDIALKVLRRHRLIELFLVHDLGYELHEVHEEAENLEHAVSDRFISALATRLGDPTIDPHGDPIPGVDGTVTERQLLSLADLPLNCTAKVSRFVTHDNDVLQFTLSKGFKLQSEVRVLSRDPFEGPLQVAIDAQNVVISHALADAILVEV
jgi:DtxR family Mn-dependent transcriptional regulator